MKYYKMKNKKKMVLIDKEDVNDGYYDVINNTDNEVEETIINKQENKIKHDNNQDNNESIYLIQNYCTWSDDKKIAQFLKFCVTIVKCRKIFMGN